MPTPLAASHLLSEPCLACRGVTGRARPWLAPPLGAPGARPCPRSVSTPSLAAAGSSCPPCRPRWFTHLPVGPRRCRVPAAVSTSRRRACRALRRFCVWPLRSCRAVSRHAGARLPASPRPRRHLLLPTFPRSRPGERGVVSHCGFWSLTANDVGHLRAHVENAHVCVFPWEKYL